MTSAEQNALTTQALAQRIFHIIYQFIKYRTHNGGTWLFKLKPWQESHIAGRIPSFAGVLHEGPCLHEPITLSFALCISVTDCAEDFVR